MRLRSRLTAVAANPSQYDAISTAAPISQQTYAASRMTSPV